MAKLDALFSSETDEWYTPQDFFDKCSQEVGGFDLDPCATSENAKCEKFYTKDDDGLSKVWEGKVWCNPPYGREIYSWIEKCYESKDNGLVEVIYLLIPSRTDTKYFHNFLYQKELVELRFLKGRLKFGGSSNTAPFPSLLAILKPNK